MDKGGGAVIARVLVDVPAKSVDKLFDYLIPAQIAGIIETGMRVIVPFNNRKLMGYCLEIAESSDYDKDLKEIDSLVDLESYLTDELIELAKKIRNETATVLIRILETMLPSAMRMTYTTKLRVKDRDRLPDKLVPVFASQDEIILNASQRECYPELKNAIKEGVITSTFVVKSKGSFRMEKVAMLLQKDAVTKSEKQNAVIAFLQEKENMTANAALMIKKLNVTMSVVESLAKKGIILLEYREKYRDLFSLMPVNDKTVILNKDQEVVMEKIRSKYDSFQVLLLHGVTSSGKTEIYLKAIGETIAKGKEVIFLVPEISLTPMMVSRFKGKFGEKVAILHSGLSLGEKFDEWRKIVRGEVKIVIGARSACFAPFRNIGLLVVDECHESSYKQDDIPKYYAIDILEKRAQTYNIPLLLGSATPNIDSYARFKRGYYELLELKHRAMNSSLPDVTTVDMKQEFKNGNSGQLSELLISEIARRLEKGEQTILLLNRRGFSTFVICRNCGHVFTCPECDISLTYHEADHSLKCHYCNHKEPIPKVCPDCKSEDLRYFGSGTQKIEAEVQEKFPNARIVRMDNDTTRTKNAHEKLLYTFEKKGDILLGTQMIAKGLDFPRVTLVGIIQADGNLYHPDFRAPEKTFQLIVQVAGRAGRRDEPGKVIIQAFNPDHYAIRYACNQDYDGFYNHEMQLRRIAKYSPFYFLAEIKFSGPKMRDLFISAQAVVKLLRSELAEDTVVLGPALPPIPKIRNQYSCQILVKYRHEEHMNDLLNRIRHDFENDLVRIAIDRNPALG